MSYITLQQIREASGFQFNVEGETLTGTANGTNKVFYTSNKPIVDADYDDTVDASDITVYVDGTEVTVSSVDALTGKITLENAPSNGATVTADYSWSSLKDERVDDARDKAESEVNGALTERYTLPLSEVPVLIEEITTELAAGILIKSNYALTGGRGDEGLRRQKEARNLLEKVRKGDIKLVKSDGTVIGESTAAEPDYSNVYESTTEEKGELFTIDDENFAFSDPDDTDTSTGEDKDWY